MWFYIIWIPIAVLYYALGAYLSRRANIEVGSNKFFIILFLWNILGVWPFIAKFSKNLLFDALLYDVVILLAYYSVLICLNPDKGFSMWQWIGLVFLLIGMTLFKIH